MKHLLLILFPLSIFAQQPRLFDNLKPEQTGIYFKNVIEDDEYINFIIFTYYYNGGGVAIGDIDNDGLSDVFLTSNRFKSRLFKNKGNFKFEDITLMADVGNRPNSFYTGVAMVDINNDGWMDIYLCKTLMENKELRRNELYINNHDGTFSEKAKEYGLDDPGYSNQAYFYDMDNDGDLDMFLLNYPFFTLEKDHKKVNVAYDKNGELKRVKDVANEFASNKLYINQGGKFVNVTKAAGLESNDFGLSAIVEDMNGDGLADIYLCNDFKDNDYLYINKGNNVFEDEHLKTFQHHSFASMGSDYADFNNDGLSDLLTMDMLPEYLPRIKQLRRGDNYDQINFLIKYGYGKQYERNTLQKNIGNGKYADISFATNTARSDWSWAPLLADFDNDGLKDLYITNGFIRDVTDLDYLFFSMDSINKITRNLRTKQDIQNLFAGIPSIKVRNYYYKNIQGETFQKLSKEVGIDDPSWSFGAAYGDLDNDGDLDIIVNNTNDEPFVHKNLARENGWGNFVKIKLHGPAKNINAIGAKIEVEIPNEFNQTIVVNPYKGYISTHDLTQVFGLRNYNECNIKITWPDGKTESMNKAIANKSYQFYYKNAVTSPKKQIIVKQLFDDITAESNLKVVYRDNPFIDFRLEPLLPYQLSRLGPCLSKGDLNGDGLEDIVLGGAVGFATSVFMQNKKGSFDYSPQSVFEEDKQTEDGAILLEDFDGDGDRDMLIACGGNEFSLEPKKHLLKYYINTGSGKFEKVVLSNNISVSSHTLVSADFDKDGKLEIYIGAKSIPGHYGRNPTSYIVQIHKDKIHLIDSISRTGMITTAAVGDINKDGWQDLIIGGEWQPIRTCYNEKGKINWNVNPLASSNGWWRNIQLADIDNDGDIDIIAGNHGINTQYQGNEKVPLQMFVNDFDKNGSTDIVINYFSRDGYYPIAIRDNMVDQMPFLKKRYNRYRPYSTASIAQIFNEEQLTTSSILFTNEFNSCVFINTGDQGFVKQVLPIEAQYSSANGIVVKDLNNDQLPEIIITGNTYCMEVETGQNDAGTGLILENKGKANFVSQHYFQNGFYVDGDVKCLLPITINGKYCLIAAKNEESMQVLRLK